GVEHRVDVAQAADRLVQGAGVCDLDHEPVLDHRVVNRAASFQDVDACLGEGSRHVLQQAVTIPAVDLQLHAECGLGVAVPGHRGEPLGVLLQYPDVGTVSAMDGDPAAQRDVAHDRVPGHGPAALGQAQHD